MPTSPNYGRAQTVTGLIDPGDLGTTLMHEHLLLDVSPYFEMPEEASVRAWVDAPLTFGRLGYIAAHWHENLDNTVIRETHVVTNLGPGTLSFGLRKLWDWQTVGCAVQPATTSRCWSDGLSLRFSAVSKG